MRILVIEDRVTMADALRRALESQGCTVDLAYDGQQGLDLGRNNQFDLMILDIMLPSDTKEALGKNPAEEKTGSIRFNSTREYSS